MTNTILLADDSVTIQKVIELTFMDEDYEVVAVGNGDEALDQLEELEPDVVIADVHMPGASGYDVARRAKQLHPQAPVLLLVGTFEPFDEDDFRSSGADGHLKKPFDSQELLQRVSELMAARAGLTPGDADRPAVAESPAPADETPEPPAATADSRPSDGGEETRFVPGWDEGDSGAWRPSDEAGEDSGVGTQRMPTFGAAGGVPEEPASSGWDLTGEPEEVESPITPMAEESPSLAGEEASHPAWESVDVPDEPEPAAETPSWALDETEDEATADETAGEPSSPPPAAATAPTPPPAVPAAPPAAAAGSTATRDHEGDPFPELAQRAGTATPPASAEAPAAPEASDNGREATLSAADVDRVARRVAELLGDRVIREIAWEVVPDLAEVVIKDRLRELESQVD